MFIMSSSICVCVSKYRSVIIDRVRSALHKICTRALKRGWVEVPMASRCLEVIQIFTYRLILINNCRVLHCTSSPCITCALVHTPNVAFPYVPASMSNLVEWIPLTRRHQGWSTRALVKNKRTSSEGNQSTNIGAYFVGWGWAIETPKVRQSCLGIDLLRKKIRKRRWLHKLYSYS